MQLKKTIVVLTSLIMSASFFSSSMLTSHAEENQTKIFGDINGDGIIDGRDATTLLTYYAKTSTGYTGTLEQFIAEQQAESTNSTTAVYSTTTAATTAVSATTAKTIKSSATAASTTTATTTKSSTTTLTTTSNSNTREYISKTDAMYFLWMDKPKSKDYFFNGKCIRITFKIKGNIPSKDYAVRFNPDLASVSGVVVHPDKIFQGTIRVGSGSIEPTDVSSANGFVLYGDSVACNQGDTIDYYINFKNNTGLGAMLMWFYYDKNAMEIESITPVNEFAKAVENGEVSVGTKDD